MSSRPNPAITAALQSVFSYATSNFDVLDDALVPPLASIQALNQKINDAGIESLKPEDGEVLTELTRGLSMLNARAIPGEYSETQFYMADQFGRDLKGMVP